MNTLREFEIPVAPGVTLSCAEQGPSTGPTLLLLHGYSDSWRSYQPLLAELPPSIRAIAVTQRGHGDSSKPDRTYAIADLARDIAAAMDGLGIASATVVGHSMGSLVAQRLARDCPNRVDRLVLIGAFAALKGNAGAEEMWRDAIAPMTDVVDPAFVREFQESTLARPIAADFLETVIAESRKMPTFVWQRALRSMLDTDESAELCRIVAPTLLLWGDRDSYCGNDEQALLAMSIPRASLSVLHGAGHSPHWEDPKHVAAEITTFIQTRTHKAA